MPSLCRGATCGWRREVFHCLQLTQIFRNSRSLCTIPLQIPSLMPLEMRKVQLCSGMGAGFGVAGQDGRLGLEFVVVGVRRDQADCRPGFGGLLDDPDGEVDVFLGGQWLSGIEFLQGLIGRRRSPRAERGGGPGGRHSGSGAWSCWESRQVDGWRGPKGFTVLWGGAQWVFRPGMPWSRAGTVGLRRESGGLVRKSVLPQPPCWESRAPVNRLVPGRPVLLPGAGPPDGSGTR